MTYIISSNTNILYAKNKVILGSSSTDYISTEVDMDTNNDIVSWQIESFDRTSPVGTTLMSVAIDPLTGDYLNASIGPTHASNNSAGSFTAGINIMPISTDGVLMGIDIIGSTASCVCIGSSISAATSQGLLLLGSSISSPNGRLSTIIGNDLTFSAQIQSCVGFHNNMTGARNVIYGSNITSTAGTDFRCFGNRTSNTEVNTTSIGNDNIVTHGQSVILGNNQTTTKSAEVSIVFPTGGIPIGGTATAIPGPPDRYLLMTISGTEFSVPAWLDL